MNILIDENIGYRYMNKSTYRYYYQNLEPTWCDLLYRLEDIWWQNWHYNFSDGDLNDFIK